VLDIAWILNNKPVLVKAGFVYSGKHAKRALEINYKPASVSFTDYAAGSWKL
jgi:hypothetical protein